MRKLNMLAALLVLIIANCLMFTGILWNRSGEPSDMLTVTQCEFDSLSSGYRMSTGRSVWLRPDSIEMQKTNKKYAHLFETKEDRFKRWQPYYVVLKKGYWRSKLIDGGRDFEKLQSEYTRNRNTVIDVGYLTKSGSNTSLKWRLAYRRISIESKFREDIKQIKAESFRARIKRKKAGITKKACSPTHYITINWGQRGEPWISAIAPVS